MTPFEGFCSYAGIFRLDGLNRKRHEKGVYETTIMSHLSNMVIGDIKVFDEDAEESISVSKGQGVRRNTRTSNRKESPKR